MGRSWVGAGCLFAAILTGTAIASEEAVVLQQDCGEDAVEEVGQFQGPACMHDPRSCNGTTRFTAWMTRMMRS